MKVLVIGGEFKWAQKVVKRLRDASRGKLVITEMNHLHMSKRRRWKHVSQKVGLVIVITDAVRHKHSDWARYECKMKGIPLLEIPQKLSHAMTSIERFIAHINKSNKAG